MNETSPLMKSNNNSYQTGKDERDVYQIAKQRIKEKLGSLDSKRSTDCTTYCSNWADEFEQKILSDRTLFKTLDEQQFDFHRAAAICGREDIMKTLIEHEIEMDPKEGKPTALYYAIKNKQKTLVRFMVENKQVSNIFSKEAQAWTETFNQKDCQSLMLLLDLEYSDYLPAGVVNDLLKKAVDHAFPESVEIILRRGPADITYIRGLLSQVATSSMPIDIKEKFFDTLFSYIMLPNQDNVELSADHIWPSELRKKVDELRSLPPLYHLVTKGKKEDLRLWFSNQPKQKAISNVQNIDSKSIAAREAEPLQTSGADSNNQTIQETPEDQNCEPMGCEIDPKAVKWAVEALRPDNLSVILDQQNRIDYGKEPLDFASRRMDENDKVVMDKLFQCIEILAREPKIKFNPQDLMPFVFGPTETKFYDLAKHNRWDEISFMLTFGEHFSSEILNEIDPISGKALVHLICQKGKVDVLELLVRQENFDPQLPDKDRVYPMHFAKMNTSPNQAKLVELLEHAGANSNAQSTSIEDVLYDAIVKPLSIKRMQTLLREHPDLVSKSLKKSKCPPLILAAQWDRDDQVKLLLSLDAKIDAVDDNDDTALICAAVNGFKKTTNTLIDALADTNQKNKKGQTVIEKLQSLENAEPISHGLMRNRKLIIDSILELRSHPDEAYREKLTQHLLNLSAYEAFKGNGFNRAVNCNPELARDFLNDCVEQHRHQLKFTSNILVRIFKKEVDESPLYALINIQTKDEKFQVKAKELCLEHVVMRHIMNIKWELFAERKYTESLLVYISLVVCMTISSISIDTSFEKATPSLTTIAIGIIATSFTTTGLVLVQCLRPHRLSRVANIFNESRKQSLPSSHHKKKARILLLASTIALTALSSSAIILAFDIWNLGAYFMTFNNIVLAMAAFYFVIIECMEWSATGYSYFNEFSNFFQLPLFVLILTFFAPMKFGWFGVIDLTVQIAFGGVMTFMLWVLSVQYFEVVPSVGFMMPLMSKLGWDVHNFFIFLAVFQIGIGFTYYQIFYGRNTEAFSSIWQSFFTGYFALFGGGGSDAVESLGDITDSDKCLYVFAAVVMMFHTAALPLVLMNVFQAMLNNTVSSTLERAHTEALASYAQCIVRIERSMHLKAKERKDMTKINGELNPVFKESVPKSQFKLICSHDDDLEKFAKKAKAWQGKMAALNATFVSPLQAVQTNILKMQRFTKVDVARVLQQELGATKQALEGIDGEFKKITQFRVHRNELETKNKFTIFLTKTLATYTEEASQATKEDGNYSRTLKLYNIMYKTSLHESMQQAAIQSQDALKDWIAKAKPESKSSKKDDDDDDDD